MKFTVRTIDSSANIVAWQIQLYNEYFPAIRNRYLHSSIFERLYMYIHRRGLDEYETTCEKCSVLFRWQTLQINKELTAAKNSLCNGYNR